MCDPNQKIFWGDTFNVTHAVRKTEKSAKQQGGS